MSNQLLHQNLTSLRELLTQLETAIELEIPQVKNCRNVMSILSQIHDCINADWLPQLANNDLYNSQELLQSLIDNTNACIFVKDFLHTNGNYLLINHQFEHLFNVKREQLEGKNDYDIFPKAAADMFRKADLQVLESGQLIQLEETVPQADGMHTYISIKFPLFNSEGKPYAVCGIATDISDRKQAELALQQAKAELEVRVQQRTSELFETVLTLQQEIRDRKRAEQKSQAQAEFLQSIWDGVDYGIFVLEVLQDGADYRYLAFNPKANIICPVPIENLLGKKMTEALPAQVVYPYIKRYLECIKSGKTIAFEERFCMDEKETWSLMSVTPLRDSNSRIHKLVVTATDISDRKIAETELQSTQKFLKSVLDNLPVGVAAKEAEELRFVLWNPAIEEVLALTAQEVLGKNDYDFFPQEQADFLVKKDREALNSGQVLDIPEEVIQTEKGETRILHTKKTAILDPQGKPKYLLAITEDITERKQAEKALRQSETQLRQKALELEQALRELTRTQAQLIQSEKMSGLGQLVAGVAHEINNPVSFIYGNVMHAEKYIQDLLDFINIYQKNYVNPGLEIQAKAAEIELDFLIEDLPKLLSSMKVGAERIQKIVLSLRTFSRMDESEKKAVNIHDGIDSTLMILEHRLKAKPNRCEILVLKEYGDLPLVECYAGKLNQVFMNILANAIDALEESYGSSHSINSTTGIDQHWKEICLPPSPIIRISTEIIDTNWVLIRIADNGMGMTETVKNRLFDPFFTTKPVGKGTGMGLSISYQIVTERHGGSLDCISSPGQGAEFAIKIPLSTDASLTKNPVCGYSAISCNNNVS